MHSKNIISSGAPLNKAEKAIVMLHGRGASAEDIISLSEYLNIGDYSVIAPQATNNSWYPYSFLSPPEKNEPWLSSALELLSEIVEDIAAQGIKYENIFFVGFSQGSCLALEFAARNARKYGGVAAFTGGLIGDKIYSDNYKGNFEKTQVFIGTSDPDQHVPVERVKETSRLLEKMNADVLLKIYGNMGHTINRDEIDSVNDFIFSRKKIKD